MTSTITRRDFFKVSAAGGGLLLAVPLFSKRQAPGQAKALNPGLWVHIAPDDTITITIAKSEMGQGVRTSLAMLVAEELDADWARVKVAQADFDQRYGDQGTGGSDSVPSGWKPLRETGAALRSMLVTAAATRWSVAPSTCTTESSTVVHAASGRRLRYGELAAAAASIPVPASVVLKPKSAWRLLGKDRHGIDLADITHGRAQYGLDVKVPGMLYASVERATVFGATVATVDDTEARKVPGVRDVVRIDAVPDAGVHAGVAVLADNTWAAMQGRRALKVTWNEGPRAKESSASYREQMKRAVAVTGAEVVNKFGDPDAVLGRASVVINAEYEAPFLSHATMEPMNCTASFKDGKVEIWSPTQFPDWATGATAGALKIPGTNVTVHVTLMGGGFGRRINPDFTVEAALISKAAGKAVKVVWNRSDDLRHDFYRPCAMHRFDASLGADGFPEAWRHRLANPAIGAFYQGPKPGHGKDEADGSENMAYRIPNRSVEYTLIESGVPRGWWRAVSTTHAVFAVESFIDELAAIAGKDPVEYRLALIDQIPGVKPDPASADFAFVPERLKGVLRTAAEKAGWGKPLPAGHAMGIACGRDHRSYAAEVVEVARVDGGVRIVKVVCAADCGPVMNPTGARAQLEGGIIMALSAATKEAITIAGGAVEQTGFDRYPLLRMNEAPPVIETHFVETDMHPTGLGEPSVPPLAPALANAITKLTGKRPRSMPFPVG